MIDGTSNQRMADMNYTEDLNSFALRRTGADQKVFFYRKTVSTRPFPRLFFIGAFLAAATLLLAVAAPAQAQVLVSNTSQTNHGHTACVSVPQPLDCAQGFTTGQNTRGYSLASIDIDVDTAPGSGTLTVTVRAASGSGHPTNEVLYTLTNPTNVGTGIQTFTTPGVAHLNRNTQYFVHMTFSGSGTRPRWNLTANNMEDSGSHIGWSVGNHRYTRESGGTGDWVGAGGVYSASIQIRVNGYTLAPSAPTNLAAVAGDRQITLSWDNPGNNTIAKYQFSRNAGSIFPTFNDIIGSSATTTTHTLTTGLANGTRYTLAVRALNIGGQGAVSTVTATPLWPAPTNLAATPGDSQVTLEWDRNSEIATYRVRTVDASGSATPVASIIPSGSGSKTTAIISGLTNGTDYTFTVQAVKTSGSTTVITGEPSTVTATMRPTAPANLWPAPGDSAVTLSWTNPDNDTITKYQYRQKTVTGDYGSWIDIPNSDKNTTTHMVTGLTNGTRYRFGVRAVNDSGPGRGSTSTARPLARPAAPEKLSPAPGDGQVTLSWTNPGNNTIWKYQIRTDSGGNFTDISDSSWTTTTYTVTGLNNGTQYTMALRAVNASGEGTASTAEGIPLWVAPANLSATPGDRRATLTWTDPDDSTIGKYQVGTDGSETFTDIDSNDIIENETNNILKHTVTGLTNGTAYTLALRAANDSVQGPASTATARPLWPAPVNLKATTGNMEVELTWKRNDEITHYRVQTQSGGTTLMPLDFESSGSGMQEAKTIEMLTNGTEYTFTVQAVDTSGSTTVITGVPSSATATPAPVPGRPTNLSAAAGSEQVTLSWDNPNDTSITKYQYRQKIVTGDYGSWTDIPNSDKDTTTHTVIGLTNGTEYTLAVRAVNENEPGNSLPAEATAKPLWPAPTGLVAVPDNERVALQWAALDGIYLYRIVVQVTGTEAVIKSQDVSHLPGDTPYDDVSGLTNGTNYSFTVGALDNTGITAVISSATATVTATPNQDLPAAPAGLSATPGNQQVALSWNDPNDITITGYEVRIGDGSFARVPSFWETTEHTVTGLANGTAYILALRAVNNSGNGVAATVTATPIALPVAPANFDATRGSDGGEVTLIWDDPDNDTITGYQYRRKKGSGEFRDWVDISDSDISANETANTLTHTVTGLSNGRVYTFELWAVNISGYSAVSSDTATPLWPAPANLAATPDHERVHLEWDGVSGARNYTLTTTNGVNWSSFIAFSEPPSKVDDSVGLGNNPLTNGTEYTFTVWATNAGGTQTSVKAIVTATPAEQNLPTAPIISSVTPGDQQVTLSWDDPDNITIIKYQVRWKDSDDSNYTAWANIINPNLYATPPTPPTTYTATGLTNGTTYTFEVRAGNGTGEGAASSVDATPIAIPNAPENLSAAAGSEQVTLSWDNPNDTSITKYEYRQKIVTGDYGSWTDIPNSDNDTTTHTVTGLTNGTRYTFELRAVNDTGDSPASTVNARPIAVPAAPTNLSAMPGNGQVALTWDDPENDTITGYQYRQATGSGASLDWSDISDSSATTITHTVTGLTNGTAYSFEVRAVNASGNGVPSSVIATMQPAAPTSLMARQGEDRKVTLSWDDPDNNTISGYRVSTDQGVTFTEIDGADISEGDTDNTLKYTVAVLSDGTGTGLTNGTEYSFSLRAVNDSGESDWSPVVTATPLWPAPDNLVAVAGDGQVTLEWDTGHPGITRYKVSTKYTSTDTLYLDTFLSPGSGAKTTVVIITSTNGIAYTFEVQAVEISGGATKITGNASSVIATPVPVPAAPKNLVATATNRQVVLIWDDPGDSTITKYQVSIDGGTIFTDIGSSSADTTEHTVTDLNNGTGYTFAVRAVNGTGNGAESTVTATPIAVPAAPTNLSATPGNGQVALTWGDPENDTITGYQYRQATGSGASLDWSEWSDSSATTITYTVTGLTNGTRYTFELRAVNESGDSPASTVTARPIAPPAAPAISSVGPGYRKIELVWADPNDNTITEYQLSIDGGTTFNQIAGSTRDTTEHTVSGLTNGIAYTLAVRAMNIVGEGDASAANATPLNTRPTGANITASTKENESYVFTMKDFTFMDADAADMLDHVKITSLPGADEGTLSLDGRTIVSVDLPRQVKRAEFVQGKLIYTPPLNAYGDSFTMVEFKVSDGESDSMVYTITVNVVRVYSVRFGAASYAVQEGGDAVEVKVMLNPSADGALEIPISVTAQGRTVWSDYTVTGLDGWTAADGDGTLEFEDDEDTKTFFIMAKEEAEEDEDYHHGTVLLSFGTSLPTDVTKGEPATATLTIIDDEGTQIEARFRRLNAEILSKHALTIADVTNRAIGERMDDLCGENTAAYTLAGESTIYGVLQSNAQAIEDGTLTPDDVLANSAFLVPLGAVTDDMAGGLDAPKFWGRGYRHKLESRDSAFAWDGTVLTGQVGIDACPRDNLLTGLALSHSIGEFDYTVGAGQASENGAYDSRMTSVHPYLGWSPSQSLSLWATVGLGLGEIKIDDEQLRREAPGFSVKRSDTTLVTAAVGGSRSVISDESLIAGGTTTLMLKGEASFVHVEVAGNNDLIEKQTVYTRRVRLALEGSYEQELASGGFLTPSLELGLRHDGGDGATGGGVEVGGSLRYRNPAKGLTIEGRGRVLAGQGDYREWGLGGSFRLDPGVGGHGISLSMASAYGDTASGVDRLWDQEIAELATDETAGNDNVPQMRLDVEFGYGLSALGGHGLLTPYGGFSLAGDGTHHYRIGGRFEIGSAFNLSLEGERREPANDAAVEHGIVLRGQLRF